MIEAGTEARLDQVRLSDLVPSPNVLTDELLMAERNHRSWRRVYVAEVMLASVIAIETEEHPW